MNPSRGISLGSSSRPGSGRLAFTMIELMVVLVIIGLMAAIAVPSFMRSMADARLESSANRLFLDIKEAKLGASRTRTRHFVRLSSPNANSWLVQSGPNDSIAWSDANTKGKLVLQRRDSLEAGVSFGVNGLTKDSVDAPGSGIFTKASAAFMTSASSGTKDDCTDGASTKAPPAYNNKGWQAPSGLGGLIVACGGPLADLSLGVLYLVAERSNNAFAISYNHMGGLSNQVRMFKFDSKTWREVQ